MAMVCPQCNRAFEQRLRCPQCDVRLVYLERRRGGGRRLFSGWQHTPWGRILIGLLLAQGLYYALRHLCVGGLLATDVIDAETLWSSATGLLLIQGLQVASLLIGGLFAGAGQKNGTIYGAVLGVWNGVFLSLVPSEPAHQLSPLMLYSWPLLQGVVGLVAGWLGSRIWKPLAVSGEVQPLRKLPKAAPRKATRLFAGPIAWVRVGVGAMLAVSGALWAGPLLEWVISLGSNRLTPGMLAHSQLVTWEIMALAMFAGSVLAGATTANGCKQGLAVGMVTAAVLVGIRLAGPAPAPESLLLELAGPILLGIGGGGFGGQLFQPLMAPRRKAYEAP
jgi:hypothetical protein